MGAELSDGLGFGANMRVALITRGLSVDASMKQIGQVVEGYHAARVLRELMAQPPQAEFD